MPMIPNGCDIRSPSRNPCKPAPSLHFSGPFRRNARRRRIQKQLLPPPPVGFNEIVENLADRARFGTSRAIMNWEPAHADHSIDNVNVLLTFVESIDPDTFDEIILPIRKVASLHHHTNRVEVQEAIDLVLPQGQPVAGGNLNFAVNFGPGVGVSRRVGFQRLAEGAIAAEFSIGAKTLSIVTNRYRRWSDLFEMTNELLEAIEKAWPIKAKIKAIRLQYVDRFVSAVGGGDHFEIIRRNTPFLVGSVEDPYAAFHVHSGWFDHKTEPGIRGLTNVNIDTTDLTAIPSSAEQRRYLSILTLGQYESLDSVLDDPVDRLNKLHLRLKNLFGSIISLEVAGRVGLTQDNK